MSPSTRRPGRLLRSRLVRAFNPEQLSAYSFYWCFIFSISRRPFSSPIIMALLLSMLLAPIVRLLDWIRVPRTLGSLIAVAAAVGALFGIAASLSGPAQSWLT